MAPSDPTSEFGLIDWIRQRTRAVRKSSAPSWASATIAPFSMSPRDAACSSRPTCSWTAATSGSKKMDPSAVGFKALGVNLSDIAAMAGVPRRGPCGSRVAANRRAASWRRESLPGSRRLADRFQVDLIGGDTNAWNGPLVISVTMIGEASARGPVCRSGARPGDAILVTGSARRQPVRGPTPAPGTASGRGPCLHESAQLHAMIDISDGLSSDLSHILDRKRRSRGLAR